MQKALPAPNTTKNTVTPRSSASEGRVYIVRRDKEQDHRDQWSAEHFNQAEHIRIGINNAIGQQEQRQRGQPLAGVGLLPDTLAAN